MKKIIILFSVLIGLFLFPDTVYADSPLTSTDFSRAYEDISTVKKAGELRIINPTIAKYLSDSKNPIDVKAAVINALLWDFNGKANAENYCKLIYKKALKDLNINNLSADQQFCFGYMLAMDDHFDADTALKYIKQAEKKMPHSFTVSIIRTLVETMDMNGNEWDSIKKVMQNSNLNIDMREDAISIILDYMALYSNSTCIEVSKNNVIIENEDTQIIRLYGTYAFSGEAPYEIVTGSKSAAVAIFKDEYGVFCLKVTGVEEGSSSIKIKNQDGKSATVNFDVVSKDVFNKLDNTIALYIGNNNSCINKTRSTLSKSIVPYLNNGVPYISLEFICEAVGGTIKYDSKKGTSTFSFGVNTIKFTNNSNMINLKGKDTKLNSKIVYKSGKQFISANDFAIITEHNYIYDEGLILIADKSVNISSISDDYVLEDMAWLVTKGDLSLYYPTSISDNGKYGYEDLDGNVVIEPIYELAYDFTDGLAAVVILDSYGNRKYGIIDVNGKYVAMPVYDWAGTYAEGLIPVIKDGKAGFLDGEGKVKIPLQYKNAGAFSGGLAPVLSEEGTKWGYINNDGILVIPYSYMDCTEFMGGLAAVQIDGKWGSINRIGEIVIQAKYDEAYWFCYGLASVLLNGEYDDINMSGLTVERYNNGDICIGEQVDGYFNGKGVYTFADGDQYTGDFLDGYFNGKGIYTWSDGSQYSGDWLKDNYTGKGVYIWPNGTQYTGEFVDEIIDGRGIMIFPDGTIEDGYWEDGIFLDEDQ